MFRYIRTRNGMRNAIILELERVYVFEIGTLVLMVRLML